MNASEYIAYGLASAEVGPEQLSDYVSGKWHWKNQIKQLNDPAWVPLLSNKLLFHQHFVRHDLSLPRMLGVFHQTWGSRTDRRFLRSTSDLRAVIDARPLSGLICKPVTGTKGAGVRIFTHVDPQRGVLRAAATGKEISVDVLARELLDSGPRDAFLVEERVPSHPFCQMINPFTASTLRIITLRGRDGEIHVPFSAVRLGRKGSIVDNVSQGGLFVEVNTKTGVLGTGRQLPFRNREITEAHPDTGRVFRGLSFPHWDEIISLCSKAAAATPGLNAVGWDVLLGPEGPVLLEGNHDWAVQVTQLFGKGYLSKRTRRLLDGHGIAV